jgi:hypothetical protein
MAVAVVGSNCTFKVAVWPGFKVSGGVIPDMVNPVPVIVAELMVTDEPPEEVSVTDCVAGEFNGTSPNDMLVALRLRTGLLVFSCKAKLSDTPPAVAVNVAV